MFKTKRFTLTAFIVLFAIYSIKATVTDDEQQLANSNFEEWIDDNNAEDWNTLEVNLGFTTYYSAQRTTDAVAGIYAAKLETQSILGFVDLPGFISLGEVNMDTFMPEGGVPFTSTPTGMSFSYKYFPEQSDSMAVFVILTKWNEISQKTDTIGGTVYGSTEETETYTRTTLPIYYQSLEQPDTINVGFISSGFSPVSGSTLYVDSILMVYDPLILPTICLPATNIQHNGFTANWIPSLTATGYYLDVAHDSDFTNFLDGYENMYIENNFPYTYSAEIANIDTDKYYYRVKVEYDSAESEYSNTISVHMPTLCNDATDISDTGFTANWNLAASASNYLFDLATDYEFTEIVSGYNQYPVGNENHIDIDGLEPETDYFYRVKVVYDTNTSQVSNTVLVTTQPTPKYLLSLTASPEDGGSVSGEGEFTAGEEVTITATPNHGYEFENWADSQDNELSNDEEYSFFMPAEDITLIANFVIDNVSVQKVLKRDVTIFPNPAYSKITIQSNENINKVKITNVNGQFIKKADVNALEYVIKVHDIRSGFYLIQIHIDKQIVTKQIYITN